MNSKYREVPRYNAHPGGGANHVANFHGHGVATTAARTLREAENSRLEAMASQKKATSASLFSVGVILIAVIFDASAWATTAWGYAEEDNFYTRVGLWQICNGSLEPLSEDQKNSLDIITKDRVGKSKGVQRCVFPTSVPHDWIHKGLVMEIMGGFCALALFICIVIFLISLKFPFIPSRNMTIAIIPLAFLAALMNFIGVLTIAINLSTIYCRPSYSVALDSLGVVAFAVGGLCALLDIQGCFSKPQEPPGPPQPPIVHTTPGVVFANS